MIAQQGGRWCLLMALGNGIGTVCFGAAAEAPPGSGASASAFASASVSASASALASTPAPKKLDRTGKTRHGKASYYGGKFDGKEMANGQHMDPDADAAASKTLPLGTTAKVTNLDTGKSDVVVVKDRGPYVAGRIVDVSPKVADKLEMKKDGVAPVEVTPLKLPPKDASAPSSK